MNLKISPELNDQFKLILQELINPLQCPVCKNTLIDPTISKCGHIACKSCWFVVKSKKCHSCNFQITNKNLLPHNRINEIKEAVQLLLKTFHEEYGVDLNISSPESSCDWFAVTPKADTKKYMNRKRKSVTDSDRLVSVSQSNSPLIFAGENIDETRSTLNENDVSGSKQKDSVEKVKKWLETSDNAFSQPADDVSLMNTGVEKVDDSPKNKKIKLNLSKTKFVNENKEPTPQKISNLSTTTSETLANPSPTKTLSMTKSTINDIIGVPKEMLSNKDNSWSSVNKMKRVLKKTKNVRKLRVSTATVKSANTSGEKSDGNNSKIVNSSTMIEELSSPLRNKAELVIEIEKPLPTNSILDELRTSDDQPAENIDAILPKQLSTIDTVSNDPIPEAKIEENVQSSLLPDRDRDPDKLHVKQPTKIYTNNQKSTTNDTRNVSPTKKSLDDIDTDDDFEMHDIIDVQASKENSVVEMYDTYLSVSPCSLEKPKVPFIFKGVLKNKNNAHEQSKVDFYYKSRCGSKENDDTPQDGINIIISSDTMRTSISIRNQPLINKASIKTPDVRICNVRDAQTSPIPMDDVHLIGCKDSFNVIINKHNSKQTVDPCAIENPKQMGDQCAIDDLEILFTSSPLEAENVMPVTRKPSEIFLSTKSLRNKSQESQSSEQFSSQLKEAHSSSEVDIIPNTEYVPARINKITFTKNQIENSSVETTSKIPLVHDKTDTELLSMEIDNDLKSCGNIFDKSTPNKPNAHTQDKCENTPNTICSSQRQEVKKTNEKTLELLPDEELLLTPSLNPSQPKSINPLLENVDPDADVVQNTPQKASFRRLSVMRKQEESSTNMSLNESLNKDNSMFIDLNTEAFTNKPENRTSTPKPPVDSSRKNDTPLNSKSFDQFVKHRSTPIEGIKARKSLDYNKMTKIDEDLEISESNELSCPSPHMKTVLEKEFFEQALNVSNRTPSMQSTELKTNISEAVPRPRKISVACSCLSASKITTVKNFVKKVNGDFCESYENKLTHLIVNVDQNNTCQRSVKYMRSLAAGIWILSYEWVVDSLKSNSIVDEEKYEVLDFSGEEGPKINRTSKIKLFTNFVFYCMAPFSILSEQILANILETAGGRVVNTIDEIIIKNPKQLHILLAEPEDTQEQRFIDLCLKYPLVPVNLEWALGCLGEGRTDGAASWFLAPKSLLPNIEWPDNLMEDTLSDD